MSTPNPALVAAAPSLIKILQAVQQFDANMGPDPTKWVVNYPGASLSLIGQIDLLLPGLVTAEVGAVQAVITNKTNGWIASLQALTPKP